MMLAISVASLVIILFPPVKAFEVVIGYLFDPPLNGKGLFTLLIM